MDTAQALKGQLRASLLMLRECITLCPDDLWASAPSGHPRTFWRIAYHAAFYGHFYSMPSHEQFTPWARHQRQGVVLWEDDEGGLPPEETTYTQSDLVEYLDWILAHVDGWLDTLDLSSPDSGFPWYPIPKLDHLILNLRHVATHVGQLQELLHARVPHEPKWVARG